MQSDICPALYRDEKGKFYCTYADREVDPGIMPCLSNYWECPIYIKAQREGIISKEEEKEVVVEEEQIPTEEQIAPEVEEITEVEEVTKPKVEIEEEVLDKLREIQEEIIYLNKSWEEYENSAKDLLERWMELRDEAYQILHGIESSIESHSRELEELEIRKRLNLISDELYQDIKNETQETVDRYIAFKNEIKKFIDNIERLILPHYKRVKASEAKPDIAKLRLSLMKLEQIYKEGKIDEATYSRIKEEIQNEITKLERLLEEVT